MATLNKHGVLIGTPKEGPSIAGWHKIVDLQRCEQEYKNKHVLRIKHKDSEDKMALAVGILAHVGRAQWFSTQCTGSIDDALAEISTTAMASNSPTKVAAIRESQRIIAAYIEHWRIRPLPVVKAVEYDVGPAPMKPNDPFFLYRTMRADDVCVYQDALNQLCIGDLKTTSDSISGTVNEYKQNGQFILGSLLWKMAEQGEGLLGPIAGYMIDVATKDKDCKFHRELIIITEFQRQWFYASMVHWLRRAAQIDEKTPTLRNTTACAKSISRKASFLCEFHNLCHFGSDHAGQFVDSEGKSFDDRKQLIEF